jgi:hypothetical protein
VRATWILTSTLLLVLLAGCYTVLTHPADVALTEDIEGADVRVPCSECHNESEWFGAFDHQLIYGWPGLLGYDSHDWWFDYYRRPWWWDGAWTGGTWYHSGSGTTADGESSWRKKAMGRDDPSGGVAPSGVFPAGAAPSTGGSAPASPPTEPGGSEKKPNAPEPANRKKSPGR